MRIIILIVETKYGRDSVESILISTNLEYLITIMIIELYYKLVKVKSTVVFQIQDNLLCTVIYLNYLGKMVFRDY